MNGAAHSLYDPGLSSVDGGQYRLSTQVEQSCPPRARPPESPCLRHRPGRCALVLPALGAKAGIVARR